MNVQKIKDLYDNLSEKKKFFKEIGKSTSYFDKIKTGEFNPTVESLEKIAKYFNKPVGYFFDEEEQSSNSEIIEKLKQEIEVLKGALVTLNEKDKLITEKQNVIDLQKKVIEMLEKTNNTGTFRQMGQHVEGAASTQQSQNLKHEQA